jgi:uncharacterized membrane protein YjgN (DUF898 family)
MLLAKDSKTDPISFSGSARQLAGILLPGFLLLIPTIGLYRFWLTSHRRRFYWGHTKIGGDALEYTGSASQLLLGFLMALAVFVPLYGLLFYLSTRSSETALIGYGGIAIFAWFLAGYAVYRARDFRLSRTLWRGIRLDQGGSAWNYAMRRFAWSVLIVATAGLVYPFMAADLWRYRYRHTWFGDRQFGFTGSWKLIAKPYYASYLVVAICAGAGLLTGAAMGVFPSEAAPFNAAGLIPLAIAAMLCGVMVLYYQSREMSRMFSAVCLGAARLQVRVQARSLIGAYVWFGLSLVGLYAMLLVGGVVVLGLVAGDAFANGSFDMQLFLGHLRSSVVTALAVAVGYLLIVAAFSFARELFLRLGYWRLVAEGASISGLDTLQAVKARGEDRALAGEGLADALNVGAY